MFALRYFILYFSCFSYINCTSNEDNNGNNFNIDFVHNNDGFLLPIDNSNLSPPSNEDKESNINNNDLFQLSDDDDQINFDDNNGFFQTTNISYKNNLPQKNTKQVFKVIKNYGKKTNIVPNKQTFNYSFDKESNQQNELIIKKVKHAEKTFYNNSNIFSQKIENYKVENISNSNSFIEEELEQNIAQESNVRQINLKETSPIKLNGQLKDYQIDGMNWLLNKHLNGGFGILSDEMGLGKTIQTISYFLKIKELENVTDPFLVIAPLSVTIVWGDEIKKFAPTLKVSYVNKSQKYKLPDCDVFIASYGKLNNLIDHFTSYKFHTVILDESQKIKNHLTKISKNASRLQSKTRFCLTGTPIENNLSDLWSMVNFIKPGYLGKIKHFNNKYQIPIEGNNDEKARKKLSEKINPIILKRTKIEVNINIPEKTELLVECLMEEDQKKMYETFKINANKEINKILEDKLYTITALEHILRLRQICCDPRLLDKNNTESSAKLKKTMEVLEEKLNNGKKIILFSDFNSMLKVISKECNAKNILHTKLDGQKNLIERDKAIKDFQENKVSLFLISLKSGGFGLNLTNADTVIIYNPWWNIAAENQAIDRAHRIGQKNPVTVIRMILKDTIEEKMQKIQKKKQMISNSIIGGKFCLKNNDINFLLSS